MSNIKLFSLKVTKDISEDNFTQGYKNEVFKNVCEVCVYMIEKNIKTTNTMCTGYKRKGEEGNGREGRVDK